MRNNCIVLSQQDIEAASILDLGRMLVGEAAEERGKAYIYRAWYVTGCTLECDKMLDSAPLGQHLGYTRGIQTRSFQMCIHCINCFTLKIVISVNFSVS